MRNEKKEYTNYLIHHGINGQKWGVRNGPPYPLQTNAKFMGKSRNEDIRIKAGSNAYRVEGFTDGKANKERGQTYVSLDLMDHLGYASVTMDGSGGIAVDALLTGDDKRDTRSVKMKITNDLIMPSYDKSISAFVDSVNKVGVKEAAQMISSDKKEAANFVKNVKHMKVEECRNNAYKLFMRSMMNDSKLKDEFVAGLKKQGYNAIIDDWDNDFGREGGGKSPVIVFERQNSLKTVGSRSIEKDSSNRIINNFLADYGWNANRASAKNSGYYNKLPSDFKKWYGLS